MRDGYARGPDAEQGVREVPERERESSDAVAPRGRHRGLRAAVRLTVLGAVLVLPAPAGAATFTVNNTTDNNAGSLRQAIIAANGTVTDDVIQFAAALNGQTITLTSGPLILNKPTGTLAMDGPATGTGITISGGGTSALLDVAAGDASFGR